MRCAARLLTRVPVLLAAVLTFVVSPDAESADRVVPTDDVVTRVVVRASATSDSVERGSFRPGDSADLPGSAPNWYEVRLDNDVHGFVSKRWTRIVSATAPPAAGVAFTIDVVDHDFLSLRAQTSTSPAV